MWVLPSPTWLVPSHVSVTFRSLSPLQAPLPVSKSLSPPAPWTCPSPSHMHCMPTELSCPLPLAPGRLISLQDAHPFLPPRRAHPLLWFPQAALHRLLDLGALCSARSSQFRSSPPGRPLALTAAASPPHPLLLVLCARPPALWLDPRVDSRQPPVCQCSAHPSCPRVNWLIPHGLHSEGTSRK